MDNVVASNWRNANGIAAPKNDTATLWARLWALVLDGIILSLVFALLTPIFGVDQPPTTPSNVLTPANAYIQIGNFGTSWAPLVFIGYYFVQEWLFGTTIGKWWAGLVVVDNHGQRLRLWQALWRNLIRPIDYAFFGIGYWLVLFGSTQRRLGDRIADTKVVSGDTLVAPPVSKVQAQRYRRWLALAIAAFALFCLLFAYYLRPPLVIQGLYNTHQMVFAPQFPTNQSAQASETSCITGYTLGTPSWHGDSVTYPVTLQIYDGTSPHQTGSITLRWAGIKLGFLYIGIFNNWEPSFAAGPSSCLAFP